MPGRIRTIDIFTSVVDNMTANGPLVITQDTPEATIREIATALIQTYGDNDDIKKDGILSDRDWDEGLITRSRILFGDTFTKPTKLLDPSIEVFNSRIKNPGLKLVGTRVKRTANIKEILNALSRYFEMKGKVLLLRDQESFLENLTHSARSPYAVEFQPTSPNSTSQIVIVDTIELGGLVTYGALASALAHIFKTADPDISDDEWKETAEIINDRLYRKITGKHPRLFEVRDSSPRQTVDPLYPSDDADFQCRVNEAVEGWRSREWF